MLQTHLKMEHQYGKCPVLGTYTRGYEYAWSLKAGTGQQWVTLFCCTMWAAYMWLATPQHIRLAKLSFNATCAKFQPITKSGKEQKWQVSRTLAKCFVTYVLQFYSAIISHSIKKTLELKWRKPHNSAELRYPHQAIPLVRRWLSTNYKLNTNNKCY